MSGLLVCAALPIEARAARQGLRGGAPVACVGMRARRARETPVAGFDALAVVGVAGALVPGLRPGDLFVASEVRRSGKRYLCAGHDELAGMLAKRSLRCHTGVMETSDTIVRGAAGRALAESGAAAVDMESALLAELAEGRPFVVLRAIVDTPHRPLTHPATLLGGLAALRALRAAVSSLPAWAGRMREVSR